MEGQDRPGLPFGTAFSWLYIPPLLYDTFSHLSWLLCAYLPPAVGQLAEKMKLHVTRANIKLSSFFPAGLIC
jgi:hypothetical protein